MPLPGSIRRDWPGRLPHVESGKPFFGICLGMQLLFSTSYENGVHAGLGLFPGKVVRFAEQPGLKIPHMGWNHLHIKKPAPHLRDLPADAAVYFVHSYYVVPDDPRIVATETDYPTPFLSAIWHENVFATQFHPEKSQRVGLTMLRNFIAIIRKSGGRNFAGLGCVPLRFAIKLQLSAVWRTAVLPKLRFCVSDGDDISVVITLRAYDFL